MICVQMLIKTSLLCVKSHSSTEQRGQNKDIHERASDKSEIMQ